MKRRLRAPRDVYELELSRIWAAVLQRDDFGVHEDFFALGGDRELAESVLHSIARQFGTSLSMDAFGEESTIERLGCRLRSLSNRRRERSLVALQPNGARRPFFFLSGGDGNGLQYQQLARRMGPDQPTYVFQNLVLYGEPLPYTKIEEMAADHIQSMRDVQPHGPYLLGGHCTGSMVALEMALQLQRCGERVAVLVACDAWAPAVFRSRVSEAPISADSSIFYTIAAAGMNWWFDVDLGIERKDILAVAEDERSAYVMERAKRHGVFPPDAGPRYLERTRSLFRFYETSSYVPAERFEGAITFLRAGDDDFCETATEGWEDVSTQPVRARLVSGNHVSCLCEPNVELIAREILSAIAEARAS